MFNQKSSKKSNYIVYITDTKYSETEEYKNTLRNAKPNDYAVNPLSIRGLIYE